MSLLSLSPSLIFKNSNFPGIFHVSNSLGFSHLPLLNTALTRFSILKERWSSAIVTYTYFKQFCKIKETLKLSFGVISFRSQKYMFKNYILLWNVSWQFHLTNDQNSFAQTFWSTVWVLKARSILALLTSYQNSLTTNTCNFMIWLHVQVYICIYEQVL